MQSLYTPIATTLLRIALGIMFIAHSLYLKLMIFTLEGTAQFFVSIGLPASLAYVVFFAEAVGGIMLILGIQARWVSLALVPVLAGATWAHWGNGWMFGYENGGWEYPAYLTLLAFCQFLLGDGRFVLWKSAELPNLNKVSAKEV
ncbi:DoxX family protein [Kordiimonas sp.]|uniref:DoxX family protein n=1 Tax=Kordiimonas sp. TaxID=1970157 RepID=UPI003B518B4D